MRIKKEQYIEAFEIALNCDKSDFEIKLFHTGKNEKDKTMLVRHKDSCYKVSSESDLEVDAESHLTTERAGFLQPSTISEIMDELLEDNKTVFYNRLNKEIDNEKWKEEISLSFSILSIISEDFWSALYSCGETELYIKAIHIATSFYDLE